MGKLRLVTAPDPDVLLRDACDAFCTGASARLPLLALRQGGLRDAVHQMVAASKGPGWLGNPVVVFAELPALLAGELAPLDTFERLAVLRGALAANPPRTLANAVNTRGFVRSLDTLFGDLIAEDVAPGDFLEGLGSLRPPEWESGRDADLACVYAAYRDAISALPAVGGVARSDGRDGIARAARAVTSEPDALRMRLRCPFETGSASRSIHIYGLGDLRRGWSSLIDALRAAPCVDELCIHMIDQRGPGSNGVSALLTTLRERADEERSLECGRTVFAPALDHARRTLFATGVTAAAPGAEVTLLAAPDITRELESVARSIKSLLSFPGAPPMNEIAVVARKARPYLTRAAQVLERYGIPVSARLRHTLTEVPAIAALLRLFGAAAGGWTVDGIAETANSPYFDADVDLEVVRNVGRTARPRRLADWSAAFDTACAQAAAASKDGDYEGPSVQRMEAAREAFRKVAQPISILDLPRSLEAWIDATVQALGGASSHCDGGGATSGILGLASNAAPSADRLGSSLLRDAARLDATALDAAIEVLNAWRGSLALAACDGRPLRVGEWVTLLSEMLDEQDITLRTGSQGGVQLVEALAAAGRPFAHVYLVGMASGAFPAEPATDGLFSDEERVRLAEAGLPIEPPGVWRDREAALFGTLVLAPRRGLHLSHAYADRAGSLQLPSAYFDEVASRFTPSMTGDGRAAAVMSRIPASHLVPESVDDVWCDAELERLAAHALRNGARGESDAGALLSMIASRPGGADRALTLLHAARVERGRSVGRATLPENRRESAHVMNGLITHPTLLAELRARFADRVWSATQLEAYGRCGFSFFAKYVLGVRAVAAESDEPSALDAGTVAHRVLAALYRELLEKSPTDPLARENFDHARTILTREVSAALDEEGGLWVADADLRSIRERELCAMLERYVHWEMQRNEKGPRRRPYLMEMAFGTRAGEPELVVLTHAGRTLKVRGQIDRVDEMIFDGALSDGRTRYVYVVDHKLGASSLTGLGKLRPEGAVLQLALYIAALKQMHPDLEIWGGAYQILHARKAMAALDRCSTTGGRINILDTDTHHKADAVIEGTVELALKLIDGIVSGHFAARVPLGTSCLRYCEHRHVCREADMTEQTW